MSLKEYEKKRNFSKTPEPAPDKKPEGGPSLRFVIHKHRATRLHFDLRLEWNGSYKSWAVPKGPSLNPTDRKLAVHVEDHPLSYGEFEGNIPKGQYGAGSVMIWDKGTFYERHSDPTDREESEGKLEAGFKEGKVTVVLQGKKLQGEFYLVRTHKDDKSWLLFKKQDKFASFDPEQIFDETSVKTGRTMDEIAEDKAPVEQPKVGTFEEVPRFFQPMKPMRSKYLPDGEGDWFFEKPLAGYRAVAVVSAEGVRIVSGWGRDYGERFKEIRQSLAKLGGSLVFDGEITSGSQTNPKELKGPRDYFRFQIYDFLHEDGRSLRELPLAERRAKLAKLEKRFDKYLQVAAFAESIEKASKLAGLKDSKELIAKDKNSSYDGGLSQSWLCFKIDAKQKEVKESASKERSKPKPTRSAEKVVITHPRKILWPKERFTKQDLVDYYDKISDVILPYLTERPLNLHRHPYGITGAGFYHKNLTEYHPSWFQTITIFSTSEEKSINYAMCQNKNSLLYLVNQGSIELNPWISKASDLDRPEFGVIDLDPHGLAFPKVVEVALSIHEVCKKAKVRTLVKTSGATGIHILIPMAGKYTFDEVRDFCHLICRIVHHDYKDIASLERNPGRRGGRMYLDYMQNRRGQTIASAYCVRPRPGIPVSTPLAWDELVQELSPMQFTVFTIHERLRKIGDLWTGAFKTGIDLEKSRKILEKLEATLA